MSRNAPTCPHCGEPKPARNAPPDTSNHLSHAFVGWTFVFVAAFIVYKCNTDGDSKPTPKVAEQRDGRLDALTLCQLAIQKASRDPEKADVPYVPVMESSQNYQFFWNKDTKLARLRNGLGLEVGTTAVCVVDKASGHITGLKIDGTLIIGGS